MPLLNDYRRVTKSVRCPICGRPDWCLVARDGLTVICARSESDLRYGAAGWFHRLGEAASTPPPSPPPGPTPDFGWLAADYCLRIIPEYVSSLARHLLLSERSLHRLRIGFDGAAYTFPMQDHAGKIVGIRRRMMSGRKLSVRGGHEGCFVPVDTFWDQTDTVLVCEGPTDTAAVLDAGFSAIGRPSCTGGREIVRNLLRGRQAVIVGDDDEPGRKGAEQLADDLVRVKITTRIIYPIVGKDVREWRPTARELATTINCAKQWNRR